ncbi:MAG: hypothetical protein AAF693_06555 [Bacteroidota bacterium]
MSNKLKIYPAQNGDSFLLSINRTHILIDGGYVNTYNNFGSAGWAGKIPGVQLAVCWE